MTRPLPPRDLDYIVGESHAGLAQLRDARILVTGGTGFFGRWFISALTHASRVSNFDCQITSLSRRAPSFPTDDMKTRRAPVQWLQEDIRNVRSDTGPFDVIVHLATPASAKMNLEEPTAMFDVIVEGARQIVNLARRSKTKQVLFASSGAVYGAQPPDLERVPEDCLLAPETIAPNSAYGEGKRSAETLLSLGLREINCAFKVARCFAFAGPGLPLDQHFAIGNFAHAALNNEPIILTGDGRPLRSYLYAADLTIWLLRILTQGQSNRVYHVGSDDAVSILDLAKEVKSVAEELRDRGCRIYSPEIQCNAIPAKGPPPRYVPSTERTRRELGLELKITRKESIRRSLLWELGLESLN